MTTKDILKAIQNGQVNEKRKHSEKKRILQALAESGYQPDYFIHHEDPDIRRSVLVEPRHIHGAFNGASPQTPTFQ